MNVLVPDTPILMHLERGGLLEGAFSCGLTMAVPDLLYERELEPENGPFLRKLGLGVIALTPDEVVFAQRLKVRCRTLSLSDCFALACANRPKHILVTGNGALGSEAIAHQGQVYGVLAVLDKMAEAGTILRAQLYDGLSRIADHPWSHLPHAEVRARLKAWAPS